MESPDQNRTMWSSPPPPAHGAYTLVALITLHYAPAWQISASIDQNVQKNVWMHLNKILGRNQFDAVVQGSVCSQLSAFVFFSGFYGSGVLRPVSNKSI